MPQTTPKVDLSNIPEERRQWILEQVSKGHKMRELGEETGYGYSAIRAIVSKNGLTKGQQMMADGWNQSKIEKITAMHGEGHSIAKIARAVQKSSSSTKNKLIELGLHTPDPANSPIKRSDDGPAPAMKYPPERYENRFGQVDQPLEPGHPLSWSAISDRPWVVL
jgi:hypothetical protein